MRLLKKLLPATVKDKIKDKLGVPSLHWSLQNLKKAGFAPQTVVDGGAYDGNWTKDFLKVFPQAKVLMVEPLQHLEPQLQRVSTRYPNVAYAMALLSAEDHKMLSFGESGTGSAVLWDPKPELATRRASMTLDTVIHNTGFPPPQFLKLDVQGYELEVLKGASNCLESTEICLLEVAVFKYGYAQAPTTKDVLSFMEDRNFIPYDISQLIRRPLDRALHQVDIIFVKKTSKLVADWGWNRH